MKQFPRPECDRPISRRATLAGAAAIALAVLTLCLVAIWSRGAQ